MKRTIVLVLCLAALGGLAAARPQFRLAGNIAIEFAQPDAITVPNVIAAIDTESNLMAGLHWEVIFNRSGLGMHYLANFDQQPTLDPLMRNAWRLDFNGDLFWSYHLFGGGALFDPFVELGVGNFGRVNLNASAGSWQIGETGEYEYTLSTGPGPGALMNMTIYPYVAAGVSLDIRGLLLGATVAYRPPVAMGIPGTDIDMYPYKRFQVNLYGGVAIGGHR